MKNLSLIMKGKYSKSTYGIKNLSHKTKNGIKKIYLINYENCISNSSTSNLTVKVNLE